mmetsp:Transcript_8569/g.12619  ORF Transcript_8569/g.12619 Transcript_8569/m.12619 type:complete len:246 (-) Transcript_8569:55-792(-)|eukprot:CAMPEP_0197244792 /NCGR_PEP_ID=MMETSP1429-20130617/9801_1 /TAXON_ID=49237 /ORGANISM="Chaetoceros  sp., Strain UNC1202" /LENGTH=245 /DNA_ID=CAMNT_0042705203 /DNA_START=159 /DNA_END=896 /DNA_ORIENTATION=-
MRSDSLADREPCPWRIVDDIGGAFAMGAIGGGTFNIIKGAKNAPVNARITGALNACAARGPVLGGQFAVWGGLFACCDCTLTQIRQKEDPWNSIISGGLTGGMLAARAGPKAMAQATVIGGGLLALIEGMGIMMNKMFAQQLPSPEDMAAMGVPDPTAPPVSAGMALPPSAPPAAVEEASSSSQGMDPFAILAGGSSPGSGTGDSGSSGSFDTFGSETQFSTGNSSPSSFESPEKKGWWPFGGSR